MSNNLDLTMVAEGQANPEVPVNDKGGQLDAALTETLSINATLDVTVTDAQYRRAIRLLITTTGVAKIVTVPAVKRLVLVQNDGAETVTIKCGTTTFTMATGTATFIYTDGTANGLKQLAIGGGGGGSGGTTKPADMATFIPGKPLVGSTVLRFNVVRGFTIPENFAGSLFTSGLAAGADAEFSFQVNGVEVGTITFLATNTVGSGLSADEIVLVGGDIVTVVAPSPQDATLADISMNFLGSRAASIGLEPFDLSVFINGKPQANATCLRFNCVRPFVLRSGLTNSLVTAGVASSASKVFELFVNAVSVGTLTFATDDVATFTFADDVFVEVNDLFEIKTPAVQDATLADVAINLFGSR